MHNKLLIAILMFSAPPVAAQVGKPVTIVDPNTATEAELNAVPGFSDHIVGEIKSARPFMRQAAFDNFLTDLKLTTDQRSRAYARAFVPIDLNDVTDAEIEMIPGVGKRMLHEFREYRPYKALIQFHREIGKYVKDDELARLEQYVFVKIDLNSATDEEILSIPGVGQRMLKEFKEYRPYKTMAQFNREIGKYVDNRELARLARYVELR